MWYVKKIEIFVGSDSAFEKIIPQNARNLTELATQLDDDNKKMEMNVIIPGQPKPKTQKKRKPIVRNLVIHADEYCVSVLFSGVSYDCPNGHF